MFFADHALMLWLSPLFGFDERNIVPQSGDALETIGDTDFQLKHQWQNQWETVPKFR